MILEGHKNNKLIIAIARFLHMYICIDSYGIYCKRQKNEKKVSWLNEFCLKGMEKPLRFLPYMH